MCVCVCVSFFNISPGGAGSAASKRRATSSQGGKVAAVPISASTKKEFWSDPNKSPRMAREKARDAAKAKEAEEKKKGATEPAPKKLKMGKKK